MSKKQKIETLEEVEQVRLRPGMYIPHINYFGTELIDNSVDEYIAGYGSTISIHISKDKEVTVIDKGRGLPIEPSEKFPDKSQAEIAFSSIRSGGKYDANSISSGLNGCGAAAINFLSEYFNVEIKRNGKIYNMRFEKGICTEPLYESGKTLKKDTGTKIVCKPDETIWKDMEDFDIALLRRRVKQLAYLNPGLTIKFKVDYKDMGIDDTYKYENGLKEYMKELLGDEEPLTDLWEINETIPIDDNGNTMNINTIFTYTERYSDNILAFTNNVANTATRSSHITGFKAGLASAIKDIINEESKTKFEITNEDTREGIIAIISIKIANPFYEGQGKDILTMPIVRSTVSNKIEEYVLDRLDKNPNEKNIIMARVIEAARVREAARKTKEATRKVKGLSGGKVPGLTKANGKNPEDLCIWLVEGDSAGGSAKEARDVNKDAILPVFGKINNVYNMTLDQILKSPKMINAIKAFGCGIGEEFDIEKLNYHHVIIMTDADVDGLHIRCLWVTLFFKYMREIIERGYLYIAQPPLYTIRINPRTKKEKTVFAWNKIELDEICTSIKDKYEITRNKGLGEQNPKELKESTMNENTRRLLQVTIQDAEECMRILDICMNDKSIKARKEFILNRGI